MSKRITVSGKKEFIQAVNALTADLSGEERAGARAGIMDALADGAAIVATAARQNAASGAPAEVRDGIFSYGKLPPALKQRKKPSALAGVSKKKSMREWRAGKHPRSPRAKVSPGGNVSMSLAAMYEFGTSRMSGTGYFSKAVASSRGAVRRAIELGVERVLQRFRP